MLKLSNLLSNEISKKKIDWEIVEKIIDVNKSVINEFEDEDCSLSDLYDYLYQKGKVALHLTDLFIQKGFDVSANEGKNGASCLNKLCWSLYDQYVVEVAERLLIAGADPNISMDEEDEHGIIDSIDWKLGSWMIGEYEDANMFEAYYLLAERAQENKEYKGIRAFRNSVGCEVEKVEKARVRRILSDGETIRTSYILTCGERKLVVSDYVDFIVNPYIFEDVVEVKDVTNDFAPIIGSKIKGLRYQNNSQAKLSFDNGYALSVGSNAARGNGAESEWLSLVEIKKVQLPKSGTVIEKISFPGQVVHGNNFQYYEETMMYLQFDKWTYSLFSHKQHNYGVSTIRVEQHKKSTLAKVKRHLDLHNMVLEEVHTKGEAIDWIRISCDEGMFYINASGFDEVGFYLVPYEIENPEKISTYAKGLIELSFPGTEDFRD